MDIIFVCVKFAFGEEPKISASSVIEDVESEKKNIDQLKGTRFEYEQDGIKLYEVFSYRNQLDLMANVLCLTDDVKVAEAAVIELFYA